MSLQPEYVLDLERQFCYALIQGPVFMKIVWTKHARDRQGQWYKKLGISSQEVEDAVRSPEQIMPGDRDALVAQVKRGSGILRVLFVEIESGRKIVTLYWTSKVDKYWEEE